MENIYYRFYRRFNMMCKVLITEEVYNLHWDRVYEHAGKKPINMEIFRDITSYCILVKVKPDIKDMKKTLFKNSHYYITGVFCPSCGEPIYQEITEDGKAVDNFSCFKGGCDFTDKPENVDHIYKNSQLSKARGIRPEDIVEEKSNKFEGE